MFEMADVIVSLWFLPVTLCIIIPLLMLCGYTIIKLFMQPKERPDVVKERDQLENAVIQTEGN